MMSRSRDEVGRHWNWRLLVIGVALMVLAPPALWSFARDQAVLFGGVALFALGWLLVGAGLQPRQRAWHGAGWAAVLYVLVGLAWEIVYMLTNPYGDPPSLALLVLIPLWPWHVAFVLGLFGLGPR